MMTTRPSLIVRVRNLTDQAAWKEFWDQYQQLIARYVRSRGIPEHEVDDVVQEVFLRLAKGIQTYDPSARFRTWLWRVTVNVITDLARKRARDDKAKAKWLERILGNAVSPSDEEDDQWCLEYRKRILEIVLPLVRPEFDEKKWACFEQHLLAGRPAAEVATDLGLTVNAVYTNTSRVLERVREMCLEYEEELT